MEQLSQSKPKFILNGRGPQNTWMQRRLIEVRIAEALGRFPDREEKTEQDSLRSQ